MKNNDFVVQIKRQGPYCTQWDLLQDRFDVPDLRPFTMSDMDFITAPVIFDALT